MTHWYSRSTPSNFPAEPWLSLEVVEFLKRLLRVDMKVLEHGSGGSTLWLAKRVKSVFSVEDDPDWYQSIKKKAPKNVTLILWDEPILPDLPEEKFDLMLVDGEPVQNRALYLDAAEDLIRPGGWVVLDNCNMPEFSASREALHKRSAGYKPFFSGMSKYSNTEFFRLKECV